MDYHETVALHKRIQDLNAITVKHARRAIFFAWIAIGCAALSVAINVIRYVYGPF
mgnify:CR=1 FL=1